MYPALHKSEAKACKKPEINQKSFRFPQGFWAARIYEFFGVYPALHRSGAKACKNQKSTKNPLGCLRDSGLPGWGFFFYPAFPLTNPSNPNPNPPPNLMQISTIFGFHKLFFGSLLVFFSISLFCDVKCEAP